MFGKKKHHEVLSRLDQIAASINRLAELQHAQLEEQGKIFSILATLPESFRASDLDDLGKSGRKTVELLDKVAGSLETIVKSLDEEI